MSLPHKEVSSVRGGKEDWFLHQILIAKSGSFLQTSLFVWRTFSPVFWYFDLVIIIIFVWLVHCQAHKQATNRPKELVFRYYG